MTLDELLKREGALIVRRCNFRRVPVYRINADIEGVEEFNRYYQELVNSDWDKILRTPSKGISTDVRFFRPPMWDYTLSNTIFELTIVSKYMLRIQFRLIKDVKGEENTISGREAFEIFSKLCYKHNINIYDYRITNGYEVKQTIEKPLICLADNAYKNVIFDSCHHVDFHNSFPAGLANTHPEFRPIIETLYNKRKVDKTYKAVLNSTIGYMQSYHREWGLKAEWAHLSRDAIADNNKRIRELAARLQENGRKVIAYNTDGIWYKGDIYHGEGEGKGLGEWENDYINCKLRFKSAGSYEFIGTDKEGIEKYHPVVRGSTKLDRIKPRSEWEWGDIYNKGAGELLKFYWDEKIGIIPKYEKVEE